MAALAAPFDNPQKPGVEIRIQAAAVKNYRGGAAAVVLGTGYATPLVPTTAGHQFIGVYLETNDNSSGVAGTLVEGAPLSAQSSWVRIAREGIFAFNQSGITQSSVGQNAYFADDNTVTTTPTMIYAGVIVTVDENASKAWVDISNAVTPVSVVGHSGLINMTASATISAHNSANYKITPGVNAVTTLTLGAPTVGTDDGTTITFINNATIANVVSASGLIQNGTHSGLQGTATVGAAQPGAVLTLIAINGTWVVAANTSFVIS